MNRKELLEYAKNVPQHPAINSLINSITSTEIQLSTSLGVLRHTLSHAEKLQKELATTEFVVVNALAYDRAAAQLSTLFLSLATTLQGMGHDIEY